MGLDVVAGCHDDDALATTAFVQPALLACDVAAFHVLEAEGVAPLGVAGHSLGQFAALERPTSFPWPTPSIWW